MDERAPHAILAAIAGFTLGAPRVGTRNFVRLGGYEPIPQRMAPSAILDSWLVWAQKSTGVPAHQIDILLLEHLPDHTEETAFGLANLRQGFGSPLSGSLENPLGNGPRALLRSAYWGLAFGGDPDSAVRYASYDAGIDHADDGIWTATALAGALATNPESAPAFWDEVSSRLPESSQMHALGPVLLQKSASPEGVQEFTGQFDRQFPEIDPRGAVATLARALLAVLSASDAWSAIRLAGGSGGSSDISAALAGLIGARLYGPLSDEHLDPLGTTYIASHCLRLDPPATIAEFVKRICIPLEPTGGPDFDLSTVPRSFTRSVGDQLIQVRYKEEHFKQDTGLAELAIKNPAAAPAAIELLAPAEWVGKGIDSVPPGESSHGTIRLSREARLFSREARLRLAGSDAIIPMAAPASWRVLGPLTPPVGLPAPAERIGGSAIDYHEVHATRSGYPAKWEILPGGHAVLDVEPVFAGGPGAVYMAGRIRWRESLPVTLWARAIGDLHVWIDGHLVLRLNDAEARSGLPLPREMAEIPASETQEIVVKLVRENRAIPPVTLAFFDEMGRVVLPYEFLE